MNEFIGKWVRLNKSGRRKAKHDAARAVLDTMPTHLKMRCTPAQLRSMAKTRVDMAFAIALRAE